MLLLKTISALLRVKVHRKQWGLLMYWSDQHTSLVYQRCQTRASIIDRRLNCKPSLPWIWCIRQQTLAIFRESLFYTFIHQLSMTTSHPILLQRSQLPNIWGFNWLTNPNSYNIRNICLHQIKHHSINVCRLRNHPYTVQIRRSPTVQFRRRRKALPCKFVVEPTVQIRRRRPKSLLRMSIHVANKQKIHLSIHGLHLSHSHQQTVKKLSDRSEFRDTPRA